MPTSRPPPPHRPRLAIYSLQFAGFNTMSSRPPSAPEDTLDDNIQTMIPGEGLHPINQDKRPTTVKYPPSHPPNDPQVRKCPTHLFQTENSFTYESLGQASKNCNSVMSAPRMDRQTLASKSRSACSSLQPPPPPSSSPAPSLPTPLFLSVCTTSSPAATAPAPLVLPSRRAPPPPPLRVVPRESCDISSPLRFDVPCDVGPAAAAAVVTEVVQSDGVGASAAERIGMMLSTSSSAAVARRAVKRTSPRSFKKLVANAADRFFFSRLCVCMCVMMAKNKEKK